MKTKMTISFYPFDFWSPLKDYKSTIKLSKMKPKMAEEELKCCDCGRGVEYGFGVFCKKCTLKRRANLSSEYIHGKFEPLWVDLLKLVGIAILVIAFIVALSEVLKLLNK